MSAGEKPKSRLPPQTLTKMRSLNETALKLYAYDLLSSYDGKARKLKATGKRMGEEWVERQGEFLDAIAEELRQIIENGEAP